MLQRAETPVALNGVEASRSFFAPCFAGEATERLWVAHVDGDSRCIHLASYDGPVDSLDLPVRDILDDALKLGSTGIVLAHNHPGGSTTPSPNERAATRTLA